MSKFELEGLIVKIERRGEIVEGRLKGSKYGSHYNAEWTDSDGKSFIGVVEEWEIKEVKEQVAKNEL